MKVRVLSTLEEVRLVEPAWQHLADVTGGRATSQPWWCLTWWRHLGSGVPLIVTAWRNDNLVALVPLHERRICGVRVVRFLGHGLG
nr:hypothetical protein [Actinomycetota bacterium]